MFNNMAARSTWCRKVLVNILRQTSQPLAKRKIDVYRVKQVHNQSKLYFTNNLIKCNKESYCSVKEQSANFLPQVRFYAKSKDKKKSDKGNKKKVVINDEILSEAINVEAMEEQMKQPIDNLKEVYIKSLSLRSTSGSIETLPITYEGKDYILQDVAQVVRKNPKTVVINMIAFPQLIPTVIQTINKSGMNLNPQQDGTTLYIPIPKITKEHRETLAKNAKTLFVKCRDSIKDVQNKFIKTIKNKEKDGLAKDTSQQIIDYVMYKASEHISEAEKIMEAKQQELLQEIQ